MDQSMSGNSVGIEASPRLGGPSTNAADGGSNWAPPSGNGENGGEVLAAPSTNRSHGEEESVRPSPNGAKGRDARGRFAPGNAGGPGNPFGRRVAGLRRGLLTAVTEEDVQAIAAVLVKQARQGDLAAVKLLFAYVIGKPADAPDPDTLDVKEWELYQQSPARTGLITILKSLPADVACAIVRTTLPPLGREFGRQLVDQMAGKARSARDGED